MKTFRLASILAAIAIAWSLYLISCSKTGSGSDADDGNTPYNILDLRVVAVTDSSITLNWTATGDDSNAGTASYYDIRGYDDWITPSNWDSTTKISGAPKPHAAGQTDSITIKGLMKDSTYYFALKAGDEAGNWSGQSNCVSGTCFTDIAVTFPDPNLESAIRALISKPSGIIYRSDLMSLIWVGGNNMAIKDLSGVEYCTNALAIYMSGDSISDLSPLANMTKLRDIQFFQNKITDITPLAGLVNTQRLILSDNTVSDITAIAGLINLQILMLNFNNISDLGALVANSGLGMNDTIYVQGNPLSPTSVNTHIPSLESRGVTVIH
jgi:Fibronectin type III domain